MPGKAYDRVYFDRWYRNPRTRHDLRAARERKVAFALAAAELLLERPVRSVLDVGCGEAAWQPILERMRPKMRYAGVDSSPYAVARFGERRNLRLSTFGRLGELGHDGPYDLVVCSDMLHYVPTVEVEPGLRALAGLVGGVAFIEVFTSADSIIGDMREIKLRSPAFYDRRLRAVGLVHCGLYCFAPEDLAANLTAFELGGLDSRPRRSPRPARR
jgi:SAM-dependent methyltransferase